MPKLIDTIFVKKSNQHEVIRLLFGSSFTFLGWIIPKQKKGDGIMGKNCISAKKIVKTTGDNLVLHLNFKIVPKSILKEKNFIKLYISLYHITARTDYNQGLIEDHGPSILTAGESIHCGPNNDWDWTGTKTNASSLADALKIEMKELKDILKKYGKTYVANTRNWLLDELKRVAKNRLRGTLVVEGDGTWVCINNTYEYLD